MITLGALVNGIAAFLGGLLGLIGRRWVSQELGDFLMQGLGLCIVLVGIDGMLEGNNIVVAVISMTLGGVLGFWLDIDKCIYKAGDAIQEKVNTWFGSRLGLGRFSEGFIPTSLFICIGAMAIIGSMQSGLQLDHSTLFAKALIDLIVVMIMASTLGIGAPFAGVCVFVYEAILALAASWIAPLLTDAVIAEMVCTGSMLLLALGLNMLKVTTIKVANFLPAVFIPIAFFWML